MSSFKDQEARLDAIASYITDQLGEGVEWSTVRKALGEAMRDYTYLYPRDKWPVKGKAWEETTNARD